MTKSSGSNTPEWPWFFLVLVFILLLIGGIAAGIYSLFSYLTGVSNLWLLVCCLPPLILGGGFVVVYSLYARYGKPLQQILKAIDSVSKGNLDVRVPAEDNSPQFGELIKRFNKMVGELERVDKQRRDLTADIAHELRTPLHIIQGKLEGMLDGVYEPAPAHINDALDETKLLGRLVDDLQTLSMAESGQLPLHPSRFLVKDLLQDVVTSFVAQAAEKGVELESKVAEPAVELTADYGRLNQVLANLVSNALRYTDKGGNISLEAIQAEGKENLVRIIVGDTGAGIPAEDLPFIFDRFWRGEKARTRDGHANSGLGLAISRQLILAHAGTIEAQSDLGVGTTFTIELPNSPAA
jgi:two-component system OmpR family sensor kinase/two-component system sensor histidine kinase BaeS